MYSSTASSRAQNDEMEVCYHNHWDACICIDSVVADFISSELLLYAVAPVSTQGSNAKLCVAGKGMILKTS